MCDSMTVELDKNKTKYGIIIHSPHFDNCLNNSPGSPIQTNNWEKLPWYLILEKTMNKSGWPSGLRRCVQVAVHFCGRGFESHF